MLSISIICITFSVSRSVLNAMDEMQTGVTLILWQDYIHKVPVFLRDNLKRESYTHLTVLPLQSRDCSCYVSRPILAPPLLWLQKHTDLRYTECFIFSVLVSYVRPAAQLQTRPPLSRVTFDLPSVDNRQFCGNCSRLGRDNGSYPENVGSWFLRNDCNYLGKSRLPRQVITTMKTAIWRNYVGQIWLRTMKRVIGAVIAAHDHVTSHSSNQKTNIGFIIYLGSLKRGKLSPLSKFVHLTTHTNT